MKRSVHHRFAPFLFAVALGFGVMTAGCNKAEEAPAASATPPANVSAEANQAAESARAQGQQAGQDNAAQAAARASAFEKARQTGK